VIAGVQGEVPLPESFCFFALYLSLTGPWPLSYLPLKPFFLFQVFVPLPFLITRFRGSGSAQPKALPPSSKTPMNFCFLPLNLGLEGHR
jgi:hypothetical protein